MAEMEHLHGHTTETVVYTPEEIHTASLSAETAPLTADTAPQLNLTSDTLPMEQESELQEHLPQGTLERLVKPEEVAYEVPAEDKDVDDGQQPLGIVESCFPYLARRNSNQRHHLSQVPKTLGMCPGVRCYFGTTGFEEDQHHCTKGSTKQPDEIPLKTVG